MSTVSHDPAADLGTGTVDRSAKREGASLARPFEALRDTAANRLRDAADDGKQQIVSTMAGLVQAAREFADRLEGGAGGPVAEYAHKAADTLGDWQHSIETRSVEDLLGEARDVVRNSPGVALGVSIAAGFVLARLVRASGGAR